MCVTMIMAHIYSSICNSLVFLQHICSLWNGVHTLNIQIVVDRERWREFGAMQHPLHVEKWHSTLCLLYMGIFMTLSKPYLFGELGSIGKVMEWNESQLKRFVNFSSWIIKNRWLSLQEMKFFYSNNFFKRNKLIFQNRIICGDIRRWLNSH